MCMRPSIRRNNRPEIDHHFSNHQLLISALGRECPTPFFGSPSSWFPSLMLYRWFFLLFSLGVSNVSRNQNPCFVLFCTGHRPARRQVPKINKQGKREKISWRSKSCLKTAKVKDNNPKRKRRGIVCLLCYARRRDATGKQKSHPLCETWSD